MNRKINLNKMVILWDNILVEPIIEEEGHEGVIKPMQYEDKADVGIVIKIGEGRLLDSGEWVKPRVKEGDLVTFNKYSPTKLKIDGKDYFYIREEDIISRQNG
ncbi:MAG: hypothetical protein QQN63_05500 [Nitrosopumilus sp.]